MLCFFFPAAPIQDSCRRDQPTAVVLVFSQFLLRAEKEILLQQKTLEANAAENSEEKISYVYNEWKNEEKIHKRAKVPLYFYLLFAPLPPYLLLL
jgi:hypothetical protein